LHDNLLQSNSEKQSSAATASLLRFLHIFQDRGDIWLLSKKHLIIVCVSVLLLLLYIGCSGCNRLAVETGIPTGDALVVIASDTHLSATADKAARLSRAINAANSMSAEAFIVSGDAVARATDPDQNYIADLMRIGATFSGDTFAVALGNHDYRKDTNSNSDAPLPEGRQQEMEAMWLDIGSTPPYQAFDIYGYTFILLNSYREHNAGHFFDKEQMEWFEKVLTSAAHAVIIMHHPVLTDRFRWLFWFPEIVTPSREPKFFELLKQNQSKICAIFVGHAHFWMSDYLYHAIPVYMTTSLGEADNYGVHVIGLGEQIVEVRRLFASDIDEKRR